MKSYISLGRCGVYSFLTCALALLVACVPQGEAQDAGEVEASTGRSVVVVVSMDGFRPDYMDRADTPFFDELVRNGAFTRELVPVFPSLTFPNHASITTGVTPGQHGISLNSFYDSERDRSFFYPGFADLLQAEPIWQTAQRQGIRAAVADWVMSYQQEGPSAAAYFRDRYDGQLSDQERLQNLLDYWESDDHEQPLQLLMGYSVSPDKEGHEFGPDAPEIGPTIQKVDTLMAWFRGEAVRLFNQHMADGDKLYLILTTDHGMSPVKFAVHPNTLGGVADDERDTITVMTGGNIGHYFLNKIENDTARQQRQKALMAQIAQYNFLDVYTRDTLPERWDYAHPTRVGDIVVHLHEGYTFSRRAEGLYVPIAEVGGPLGMHGYDPETTPNMNGITFIWRYPTPLERIDLGRVEILQLHPTIAQLLGIDPADKATSDPVRFDQKR